MFFLVLGVFLFLYGPSDVRTQQLLGRSINTDNLSPRQQQEPDTAASLNPPGIEVNRTVFLAIARNQFPDLYEKLVQREKGKDESGNGLPEVVQKFIANRRSDVKNLFQHGVLNCEAVGSIMRNVAKETANLSECDKSVLFEHYPQLKDLLAILPCNMLGFSAKHYGYVVIGCEDGRQPSFNVGTVFNYLCWISFCTGAIVVDLCTFVKILKLRKVRNLDNDKMFQRNVRFFAQSAFQNIPMFIDIALLSLGDNSLLEDKALFRIISFSLTRFTDLINSTALILFNPEARKHILKMIKKQNVIPVAISAIAPSTTIGLAGARSSQL
ncbi:hypothetical protein QR680_015542 [Steinernema hermaphroditum]|uniref:7TM GPCR serpentine receptor class x (Srx) domain-containing protein n=1 Tax=Steinernema hermaphroditum TaxID=289476 RepID=A0AA39H967_9BILA|nr:hypothetical protein QR680_015542 [Steinernema hermaphroditum]